MKRIIILTVSAILLTGCADKKQYEEAILEEMNKEADIKDYKLSPEYMAKCVFEKTAAKMPGVVAFDPDRIQAFRNYTKMLTLSKSADPKKTLDELRTDFGSPKALAEAHTNYTESLVECYATIISESEEELKEKAADEKAAAEEKASEDAKSTEEVKPIDDKATAPK